MGQVGAAELVEQGALPENVRHEAERVLRSRRNILVSGGTGSGKTTLLNALIELLPDDERIVAIEDTLELRIERSNCVRLEARGLETGAKLIEEPEELGPVPTSAGSLLAKDVLSPSRLQRRHLSRRVLIVRGNASVTDQHCTKVSLITLILQYRFATPKPLKKSPAPEGCRILPLCNPSWLPFHPQRTPTEPPRRLCDRLGLVGWEG